MVMRGASEGFKNEFLKNELLKDWIKILKYLCINKVDTKFEYPKWIFWNFVSTKNSQDFPKFFENIQFPTSHMEAENPFGLVTSDIHHVTIFTNFTKNIVVLWSKLKSPTHFCFQSPIPDNSHDWHTHRCSDPRSRENEMWTFTSPDMWICSQF